MKQIHLPRKIGTRLEKAYSTNTVFLIMLQGLAFFTRESSRLQVPEWLITFIYSQKEILETETEVNNGLRMNQDGEIYNIYTFFYH